MPWAQEDGLRWINVLVTGCSGTLEGLEIIYRLLGTIVGLLRRNRGYDLTSVYRRFGTLQLTSQISNFTSGEAQECHTQTSRSPADLNPCPLRLSPRKLQYQHWTSPYGPWSPPSAVLRVTFDSSKDKAQRRAGEKKERCDRLCTAFVARDDEEGID